jgi:spermidine synthase
VSKSFEVLDWQDTPMGPISLRRRLEPTLQVDVYEVKLGDEYLMSSLFTAAEVALARLGLTATSRDSLDVLVGGLGLGYTAVAALEDPRVSALTVIDALPQVIDWHQRRLLPESAALVDDPRTRLVRGDFFATVAGTASTPDDGRPYDVVLLDIDHTPRHVLHPDHAPFYTEQGLRTFKEILRPGGVFALWSDDPPDEEFLQDLARVFSTTRAEVVSFPNPLTGSESANSVYIAAD